MNKHLILILKYVFFIVFCLTTTTLIYTRALSKAIPENPDPSTEIDKAPPTTSSAFNQLKKTYENLKKTITDLGKQVGIFSKQENNIEEVDLEQGLLEKQLMLQYLRTKNQYYKRGNQNAYYNYSTRARSLLKIRDHRAATLDYVETTLKDRINSFRSENVTFYKAGLIYRLKEALILRALAVIDDKTERWAAYDSSVMPLAADRISFDANPILDQDLQFQIYKDVEKAVRSEYPKHKGLKMASLRIKNTELSAEEAILKKYKNIDSRRGNTTSLSLGLTPLAVSIIHLLKMLIPILLVIIIFCTDNPGSLITSFENVLDDLFDTDSIKWTPHINKVVTYKDITVTIGWNYQHGNAPEEVLNKEYENLKQTLNKFSKELRDTVYNRVKYEFEDFCSRVETVGQPHSVLYDFVKNLKECSKENNGDLLKTCLDALDKKRLDGSAEAKNETKLMDTPYEYWPIIDILIQKGNEEGTPYEPSQYKIYEENAYLDTRTITFKVPVQTIDVSSTNSSVAELTRTLLLLLLSASIWGLTFLSSKPLTCAPKTIVPAVALESVCATILINLEKTVYHQNDRITAEAKRLYDKKIKKELQEHSAQELKEAELFFYYPKRVLYTLGFLFYFCNYFTKTVYVGDKPIHQSPLVLNPFVSAAEPNKAGDSTSLVNYSLDNQDYIYKKEIGYSHAGPMVMAHHASLLLNIDTGNTESLIKTGRLVETITDYNNLIVYFLTSWIFCVLLYNYIRPAIKTFCSFYHSLDIQLHTALADRGGKLRDLEDEYLQNITSEKSYLKYLVAKLRSMDTTAERNVGLLYFNNAYRRQIPAAQMAAFQPAPDPVARSWLSRSLDIFSVLFNISDQDHGYPGVYPAQSRRHMAQIYNGQHYGWNSNYYEDFAKRLGLENDLQLAKQTPREFYIRLLSSPARTKKAINKYLQAIGITLVISTYVLTLMAGLTDKPEVVDFAVLFDEFYKFGNGLYEYLVLPYTPISGENPTVSDSIDPNQFPLIAAIYPLFVYLETKILLGLTAMVYIGLKSFNILAAMYGAVRSQGLPGATSLELTKIETYILNSSSGWFVHLLTFGILYLCFYLSLSVGLDAIFYIEIFMSTFILEFMLRSLIQILPFGWLYQESHLIWLILMIFYVCIFYIAYGIFYRFLYYPVLRGPTDYRFFKELSYIIGFVFLAYKLIPIFSLVPAQVFTKIDYVHNLLITMYQLGVITQKDYSRAMEAPLLTQEDYTKYYNHMHQLFSHSSPINWPYMKEALTTIYGQVPGHTVNKFSVNNFALKNWLNTSTCYLDKNGHIVYGAYQYDLCISRPINYVQLLVQKYRVF